MQEGVSEVQVSGVLWHGYACYTRCMMMRSLRDARRACSCWASMLGVKKASDAVGEPAGDDAAQLQETAGRPHDHVRAR